MLGTLAIVDLLTVYLIAFVLRPLEIMASMLVESSH